jgi:hypothetical protein
MNIRISSQFMPGGAPRNDAAETRRQERARVREQAGQRAGRGEQPAASRPPAGPPLPDGEAARQAADQVAERASSDSGAAAQVHARMPVARVLDLLD